MTHIRAFAVALFAAAALPGAVPAHAADEASVVAVEGENQWEKFKDGAKIAGEAVVQGTRNTAEKVADGGKKAGHAIAEKYEDAKEYVKEKVE